MPQTLPRMRRLGWSTVLFVLSAQALLVSTTCQAQSHKAPSLMEGSDHHTVIRVPLNERLPMAKRIRVARNKSVLLTFPVDLRDVVVSAPELLDAVVQSTSQVYLIGKSKMGRTNALFFDATGQLLLTLEISIERDIAELEDIYREVIPGSRIKARIFSDTIMLTGSVPNQMSSNRATEIAARFISNDGGGDTGKQKVTNLLSWDAEDQVMLKVTIAEVQRSALKQLGINLGSVISSGNLSTSLLTDNALPLTAAQGLGVLSTVGVDTATSRLVTTGSGSSAGTYTNSGATSAYSAGNFQGNATLRALERHGLVRTLAEPNLTAVSGEAAKFLAGGEFPVTTTSSNGQISVSFKEYGIGLAFTPVVLSEGRINLKIEAEVSELTNEGSVTMNSIAISALKKRQAKSTVELPSGGSLAIAGLISDTFRQNVDGLPGLKDVPVLGTLFRSRDFIRSETELVVIVTPYTVRPISRAKLARPDDGLAPASELQGSLLGHLNRIYGKSQALPSGGLKGDYGFIID